MPLVMRGGEDESQLFAHKTRWNVSPQVHRAMKNSTEFHDAVVDAVNDEMAATDSRAASRIDVIAQTPAIRSIVDLFEGIKQG